MENQINPNKKPILIIAIVSILAIGAVGFAAWQYFEEVSELKEKESKLAYLPEEETIPEIKKEKEEEFKEDKMKDWKAYQNKNYRYEIKYSRDSELIEKKNSIRIDLPFSSGTNLSEKYLEIIVKESIPEKCSNPLSTNITKTETVYLNSIEFKKETGNGTAAGSWYDSVSYSTTKENQCFGLGFMLRSFSPGALYPDMPKEYDEDKESEIFNQMISTFKFIEFTETADWETYRNEEYEFEIKYPKNWNYQEEIPQPQNFGITVKFNNLQEKHILTIQNPIPEIGYEAWAIIKTEKIKIQNSEKYLAKQTLKPKEEFKNENFNNLVLVSWNLENWNKSGQINFSFLENSDLNLEILNQMLSTFKFIEIDETSNWETYKKDIFILKYPLESWNLKNERLFHKKIGDSCAFIPGGLWRNTLIKIVESVDTNFNGYEARQVKLGSNKDEVSIINVYFDANFPGKEFRISLPKDKQDKQTCENDFKEVLSTIKFEN